MGLGWQMEAVSNCYGSRTSGRSPWYTVQDRVYIASMLQDANSSKFETSAHSGPTSGPPRRSQQERNPSYAFEPQRRACASTRA